jgi:hypothetical protein
MSWFKVLSAAIAFIVLAAMSAGCALISPTTTTQTTTTAPTTITTPTLTTTPSPVAASLEMLGFSGAQAGIQGQSFTRQLPAAGGKPPYTWTIVSGALPPGLSLTGNGQIVGTPASTGTFTYRLKLADAKGASVESDITQKIGTGGTLQFVLLWAQTLSYNENQVISYVPFVQGGKLPWTFTISGLPDGVTYDPVTGLIRGTTTSAAVLPITISLKDADGNEASGSPVTVSFLVNPPKPVNISGKSVYEGTYIGIFTYEYEEYGDNSNPPKTVTGGFRLTITLSSPITAGGLTVLQITHASCSDPFFGCQMGCTPNYPSVATLPADPPTTPLHPSAAGMGIAIFFPNGATLGTANSAGALSVSFEGRTISNSLDPAIQNGTWVVVNMTTGTTFLPEASSIKFKSWSLSWSAS